MEPLILPHPPGIATFFFDQFQYTREAETLVIFPSQRATRLFAVLLLLFMVVSATPAGAQESSSDPSVYLNFDEGSGTVALDGSGHGNAATLHNVSRTGSGCGGGIILSNPDSYVAIPYRILPVVFNWLRRIPSR